ncbi:3-keto sterol reductase [Ceraceosorus bombacis]|uniref:3-keto sterol reductase n=1 Tax=Ceraceosorus bombacis TaxID=401625 RepID=A0A0P1BDG8_9BASI|nr:3-keto sterol reductase [Ceraceosorus bombacis]
MAPRPVIVITGANSGVGYGTAQRLLVQLSQAIPSDTLPNWTLKSSSWAGIASTSNDEQLNPPSPFAAPDGCVLILACRNAIKAHAARRNLEAYDSLTQPASTSKASSSSTYAPRRDPTRDVHGASLSLLSREARARGEYRRRFCQGTSIEFVPLDLGSMASALNCASEIQRRHGYVTHVILNAGSAAWTGLNWPLAVWMIVTRLHVAVTWPKYKMQRSGDRGADGYGWVWQANVGAHYILTRALLPALRATPFATPSRIIWTGSIEAYARYYDPADWQCLDAAHSPWPYESTKYQCELAGIGLGEALNRQRMSTVPSTPLSDSQDTSYGSVLVGEAKTQRRELEPNSFVVHPGVVASSIFAEYLNVFMAACMSFAFYLARWTFSPHHPIEGYKGAVAASHVALAPSHLLDPSARYGSRATFWGQEYVHAGRVDGWDVAKLRMGAKARQEVEQAAAGQAVRLKARELIQKLEGVARDVWRQARNGEIAPLSLLALHPDEFEPQSDLVPLPSRGLNVRRRKGEQGDEKDRDWEKVESEL